MSEHTPLWDNERIINATNNASNVWEARHLYDAMVKVRDDYQAELATLRARIEEATDANTSCARYIAGQMERIEELEAQLAAAWEWIPIEPGLHFIEGNNDTALLVSLDGSLLTIHATDDSMHHALSIQLSPKQYRLCRKQGGDA
jgi:hypothetical protein